MGLMAYDAVALGERELGYGRAWLDSLIQAIPYPLLAANVRDAVTGERISPLYHICTKGKTKIGIIGLVMVTTHVQVDTTEFIIEDPVGWAKQLVPQVKEQADYVIVLSHLGWGGSFALAQQVDGIDIIVAGHGSHKTYDPQRVGSTILVQAGNQGKYVGFLSLRGEISKGQYDGELRSLDKKMPEDEQLRGLEKEYSRRIRALFEARAERNRISPQAEQVRQKYAGANSCRGCHGEVFTRWAETKHAHAMDALEEKGKQFDPECVRCHSTGFRKPSGFINLNVNPELANIQCEQCHGAGNLHILFRQRGEAEVAKLGTVALERARDYGKVRVTTCLQCHTVERDDDFSYREGDLTGIH